MSESEDDKTLSARLQATAPALKAGASASGGAGTTTAVQPTSKAALNNGTVSHANMPVTSNIVPGPSSSKLPATDTSSTAPSGQPQANGTASQPAATGGPTSNGSEAHKSAPAKPQASKHSVPLAKHSVPVAKHSVPVAKHSVPIAKPTANGTISAAKPANSAPKPGNAPTKPSSAGGSSKPRETAGTPAIATSAAGTKPAKPPDGAQTAAATASQPAQAPAQLAAGAGRPPAAASRPAEAASAAAAEPAAGTRTADGAAEQPGAEALKTSSSGVAAKPADHAAQPASAPQASRPAAGAKPAPNAAKPAPNPAKPALPAAKPVSDPAKPAPNAVKPVADPAKPAAKPAAEAAKPSAGTADKAGPAMSTAQRQAIRNLKPRVTPSDSDSEDDVLLINRRIKTPAKPVANNNNNNNNKRPAAQPAKAKAAPLKKKPRRVDDSSSDEEEEEEEASASEEEQDDDEEEEEEAPARWRKQATAEPAKKAAKKRAAPARQAESSGPARKKAKSGAKDEQKWGTLEHAGVLFPPEYEPHGVKMLYDGQPVDLSCEQEEVATMFAVMKETDYMQKQKFLDNFWRGFKQVLGKGHYIKGLSKCDFTPIYDHMMAEREAKKNIPKEEKVRQKAEKDAAEAKYKTATVDGRKEQVGNFRVEPPGLFRGRGEHPKMGTIKRRVYPKDITLNIGQAAPIPEHPYPGQHWREVRHDKAVTWLAYWKDTVSDKDYKYVWLAANSTFKSDSDLAKYEKARKLKERIGDIRRTYEQNWASGHAQTQQMGVALYFIDKLALRAGHEKDEDEADTVGCCTLKVGNVECVEPDHIRFDFLGKDSMRYENEVAVDKKVFKLMQKFCKGKKDDDDVFNEMDATALNKHVQELMPGLSVKVFRTYNASIVLDDLLYKESMSDTVEGKKVDYDRANKEVAILCNHQRSVPKGHAGQMDKLKDKTLGLQQELHELQDELAAARRSRGSPKKNPETLQNRIERKKEQLAKLELNQQAKEDLKTVALGTSKINYLDPRITVSWCKRNEVPMEKIFNKSLLSKFHWAMEVEPDFRF